LRSVYSDLCPFLIGLPFVKFSRNPNVSKIIEIIWSVHFKSDEQVFGPDLGIFLVSMAKRWWWMFYNVHWIVCLFCAEENTMGVNGQGWHRAWINPSLGV
jgi:hypothetical protein